MIERLECEAGAPFGEGWGVAWLLPPWHVCFHLFIPSRECEAGCFLGFMYIKAWCLLHHVEVNGKVLLMLVPRGIWDRAGHFKGTASLFLWFSSPPQSPCVRTRSRGAGEGVWGWTSLPPPDSSAPTFLEGWRARRGRQAQQKMDIV